MNTNQATLIAITGATGGVGASITAASACHALHRATGRGTLVDLDIPGPGIEVLLGVEAEPGARWPELTDARGEVDGREVVAALPRWGRVPVLSGSRLTPVGPRDDVMLDVCAALLRAGESVVLDLPRPGAWTPAIRALVADANDVLVVARLSIPDAAGLIALRSVLAKCHPRLVVRPPSVGRVDADDLTAVSGLAVVATLREERSITGAIEQGVGPPVRRGTKLARLGDDLALALGWGGAR
ncbi:MAG: pilus assembly protein FlpE [Promicromonosporaceae bacterium]|nr:pilus assembly protein FlpE [Promicromonosporaceae bacterium]